MILHDVLRNKFHQELFDVGIECTVHAIDSDSEFGAKITFADDTDMDLVQSIIDAHDPTPIPPPLTADERIAVNTDYLIDIDFRLMMIELGIL